MLIQKWAKYIRVDNFDGKKYKSLCSCFFFSNCKKPFITMCLIILENFTVNYKTIKMASNITLLYYFIEILFFLSDNFSTLNSTFLPIFQIKPTETILFSPRLGGLCFDPSIWVAEASDFWEFRASFVYIANCRTARSS